VIAERNRSGLTRTATLMIAGTPVVVTQAAAAACVLPELCVGERTPVVVDAGASRRFTVTVPAGAARFVVEASLASATDVKTEEPARVFARMVGAPADTEFACGKVPKKSCAIDAPTPGVYEVVVMGASARTLVILLEPSVTFTPVRGLSPDVIWMPVDGGTQTVRSTMTEGSPLLLTSYASWLTVSSASDPDATAVSLTVAPNRTGAVRQALVVRGGRAVARVMQAGGSTGCEGPTLCNDVPVRIVRRFDVSRDATTAVRDLWFDIIVPDLATDLEVVESPSQSFTLLGPCIDDDCQKLTYDRRTTPVSRVKVPAPGRYRLVLDDEDRASDGTLRVRFTDTRARFTVSLAGTDWQAPVTGGSQVLSVSATGTDSWSAGTEASWVTVSASGGRGSGTLTLTAAPNTSSAVRTATVYVAGQWVGVVQPGTAVCEGPTLCENSSVTLESMAQDRPTALTVNVPAGKMGILNFEGTSALVGVTGAACTYWGEQLDYYRPNYAGRCAFGTGRWTVGVKPSRSVKVSFSVEDPLTVAPAGSISLPATAATQVVTVTLPSTQSSWKVIINEGARWWLSASPERGTATGQVTLTALRNDGWSARDAVVSIDAGDSRADLLVRQAVGDAPVSTISQMSPSPGGSTTPLAPLSLSADGTDERLLQVQRRPGSPLEIFEDVQWLVVGVGNQSAAPLPVSVRALANPSVQIRTGRFRIDGQTVTVTQAGATPAFRITPDGWQVQSEGGAHVLQVQPTVDDADWSVTTENNWLKVDTLGGTGRGAITVRVEPNGDLVSRSGVIVVGGVAVPVRQGGRGAPVNLRASVTGTTVTLSWTDRFSDRFEVRGGLRPGETLATLSVPHADGFIRDSPRSFTFEAPPGVVYVRVDGWKDETICNFKCTRYPYRMGTSDDLKIVVNVPDVPSAPENVLGQVTGDRLALQWGLPSNGGGPEQVHLDVTGPAQRRGDGPLRGTFNLGLTRELSVGGLAHGVYTMQLRAVNASGSSAPSRVLSMRVPNDDCPVPGAPQDLEGFAEGASVTLRWSPPSGGATVTGYRLSVQGAVDAVVPVSGTSLWVPNVANGTYYVRVAAVNACGTSAFSDVDSVGVFHR